MTDQNRQADPHLHWRRAYWETLEDYEKEIISLWTRPGGDVLRQHIAMADPRGKIVADIGCGPGNFLQTLNGAKRLYAVDFSDNMLNQARTKAPNNTVFLRQDLRALNLPEKVDLAICFNAIMPENHSQALTILGNVLATVKEGGTLLLVLFALESRLYASNMAHFQAAREGREEESLYECMAQFMQGFNNPLGYVKDRSGAVTRYWLEQEIHSLIGSLRPAREIATFKVNITWPDAGHDAAPWQDGLQPPWMWGARIARVLCASPAPASWQVGLHGRLPGTHSFLAPEPKVPGAAARFCRLINP